MMHGELTAGQSRGRMLLLAAALMWSTSGVIIKSPPLERMLPLEQRGAVIACYRALFAAVCLLPFVQWRRVRFRPALVPMVICFAVMNYVFIAAITRTTAAAAIFLQYTAAMWAFLFGVLLLKERVERRNVVSLVFSLAGIGWIVTADWNGERFIGTLLGLVSGLMYGGVIVALRKLRDEDSAWLIALNHVVSFVVLWPWVRTLELAPDGTQWGVIALLGISQMAIPYVLFARGMRHIPAQEAALITLLEPILNPVWVWLLWREAVPAATLIGGVLILTGLVVRYSALWPQRATPVA